MTFSESEELLAIHLQELGVGFGREVLYARGRRFRADFRLYPTAGKPILIEVQGGIYSRQAHGSVSGILKDNERLNEATIAGYRMMRFTPDQVKSGEAKQTIARVLGLR